MKGLLFWLSQAVILPIIWMFAALEISRRTMGNHFVPEIPDAFGALALALFGYVMLFVFPYLLWCLIYYQFRRVIGARFKCGNAVVDVFFVSVAYGFSVVFFRQYLTSIGWTAPSWFFWCVVPLEVGVSITATSFLDRLFSAQNSGNFRKSPSP